MIKTIKAPKQNTPRTTRKPAVQSWLPILDIRDQMIIRTDGHLVSAVRVMPVNMHLLSDSEQDKKIFSLHEVINGLNYTPQILSIARPVDLDAYVHKLERMRNDETDFVKRKILENTIRQAALMATSGETVERQFFILVTEPPNKKAGQAEANLYKKVHDLASNLTAAELVSHVCTDQELRELLFVFLNPVQAAYERAPLHNGPYMPPVYHGGIRNKPSESETKSKTKSTNERHQHAFTGLLDILSPPAIKFGQRSIQVGDVYQRVLVITDYPPRVGRAWLSRLATMPGVTVSIHIKPTDPYDLVQSIKISLGELEAKMNTAKNQVAKTRAEQQYQDAQLLLRKLDQEKQQVSDVVVTLLLTANDPDHLNDRSKQVESTLSASGIRARTPVFRQEEAYLTVGPWGILKPEIMDLGARNMPSETIAASYPFVYSGINDEDGILLGNDKSGGIVLVDFWKREGSRTNTNMTVMGRPGVGKSTAIKKILYNEYGQGTRIIIIDPEREYKDLCESLGGDWINAAGGSRGRINPLQVRDVPLDDDEADDPLYEDVKNAGALAYHFQTLRTFFKLYLRDISATEQTILEIALEEVYKQKNITWDTNPADVPPDQWPTIPDLFEYIEKRSLMDGDKYPEWRKLALLLRPAAVGADASLWSGHTTLESNAQCVVLDINQLLESDEKIRKTQFFNLLSWAWNEVAKDRTQRTILAVDEAYLLADPEAPQALQFLRNTSKRIRKYEGGLMVITHNMVDFLDPAVRRFGQALIDNPAYKLIMGQGDKDIEALTKLMTLSEKEVQALSEGRRGEAIFVAGNRRIHIDIKVTEEELIHFGTAGGR